MEAQLILNPTEFGIEPTQANELLSNLPQIIEERKIMEQQFNEVVKLDIEDLETSKKAKQLRLLIQKNRTQGINVWHKTTKDYFLKGGQFVDAIKRKEIAINERMENDLEQIEKHAEIKEAKRLDELEADRKGTLEPFAEFVPFGINLRALSEEDFEKVLTGAKMQFEANQKELERIEAERIAKEKAEEEAREQQRLENLRLKAEAEEREKQLAEERAKVEAERKAIEEKARKEREEAERLAKIEREKQQVIIKAEQEKARKLSEELEQKILAEEKAKQEELARLETEKKETEKLAKAPIKNQLSAWVNSFELPQTNVNNELSQEIKAKFEAFKKWSLTQINNI
jgi:hypothetical protein